MNCRNHFLGKHQHLDLTLRQGGNMGAHLFQRILTTMLMLVGVLVAVPAKAEQYFLQGASNQTAVLDVIPNFLTVTNSCQCCMCWETALTNVFAYWDEYGYADEGPWETLLPWSDGNEIFGSGFHEATQTLYSLFSDSTGKTCGSGANSNEILEAAEAYTNGVLGYQFSYDHYDSIYYLNFGFFGLVAAEIDAGRPCVLHYNTGLIAGHAVMVVGYDDQDETFFVFDPNEAGAATKLSLSWWQDPEAIIIQPSGCDCVEGQCCNGCGFLSHVDTCEIQVETNYTCEWGTFCGADVTVQYADRHCSGMDNGCTGELGPWSQPELADNCPATEKCVPGLPTCQVSEDCEGGNPGGVPPAIHITSTDDQPVWAEADVSWTDSDPDSNAVVMLYYKKASWFPGGVPNENQPNFAGALPVDTGAIYENTDGPFGHYAINLSDNPDLAGESIYVYAIISDGVNEVYSSNAAFTGKISFAETASALDVADVEWLEANPSDGDGILEGGEGCELVVVVENDAQQEVQFIHGMLSSPNGQVIVQDDSVTFGSLDPGDSSSGMGDEFDFKTLFASQDNVEFNITFQYELNGLPYAQHEQLEYDFPADGDLGPVFEFDHVVFDDTNDNPNFGDGDGGLESGEGGVRYYVYLKNTGNAAATDVVAYIQDVPVPTLGDKMEQYPVLNAGGPAMPPADGDYFYLSSIPKTYTGTVSTDIKVTYGDNDIESWIYDVPLFQVTSAPWLYVSPPESGFGVVAPGEVVQQVLQILNVGTGPFTVDSIQPSHPDTTIEGPPPPFDVPAGGLVEVTMHIDTAGLQGAVERSVQVVSSDARLDDPEDTTAVVSGLVSGMTPDIQLTDLPGSEESPDVAGDLIVWQDNRNGNWDIYAYSLSTGEELAICTAPGDQGNPRVGDGYVAWDDWRDGDGVSDIYALNLATQEEVVVADSPSDEYLIAVDGGLIAYRRVTGFVYDSDDGSATEVFNAYIHDRASGQTTQITSYPAPSGGETNSVRLGDMEDGLLTFRLGRVYKDSWGNWQNASDGIMKSQPPTAVPSKISDYNGGEVSTHSSRIVWGAEDGWPALDLDDTQVFMWSNGALTQVTNEETDHEEAVIGGNLIVYEKDNPSGLYSWNLDTGLESVATLMGGAAGYRMDGNLLVWEAGNNIYYKYLEQGDLAITAGDIQLSKSQPDEGEQIQVSATVHNTGSAAVEGPIDIELMEEVGGELVELAPAIVWPGSVEPGGQALGAFDISFASSGSRTIAVRASAPEGDSPGNNIAYRNVSVVDDDTDGPEILAVTIDEHDGDDDDVIEDDEEVVIEWSADDPSGIAGAMVTVDGLEIPVVGASSVVLGPLTTGTHEVSITVEDADNSPETSEPWSGSFEVQEAHPSVTSVKPLNGAVGVAPDTAIAATFDVDIDVASISDSALTVQTSLGQPVVGTISFSASENTLQFIPTELLSNGLQYAASLDGITDLKGDGFEEPYSWSFSTAADTQPPIAIISSPGNDDTVKGVIEVAGSAFDYNFNSYQLLFASADQPDVWTSIGEAGAAPVEGGLLGTWDTTKSEGSYLLKLVVLDMAGIESDFIISVLVDNAAPALSQWAQTPADLVEHDVGSLVVQVHVGDQTSGVDPQGVSIAYHLDVEPLGDYMPMTHAGEGVWTYEIADLVWEALGGATLGYVVRAEDSAGNMVVSEEQSELIDEQNDPPIVDDLPEIEVGENALAEKAIDLLMYMSDEETATDDLLVTVVEVSDADVAAWIDEGHYLSVESGGNWTGAATVTLEVGDGELSVEADIEILVAEDIQPPTPDPAEWDQVPTVGQPPLSAVMSAMDSSDNSGVEYFFEELSGNPGGDSSEWQESNEFVDEGLEPGLTYSYRVKSRDQSQALNETAWSTVESVEIGGECGDGACAEGEDCDSCPVDCPCSGSDVCHEGECCPPQCAVVECGDDLCGGSCGECSGDQEACIEGQCVCEPDCLEKDCGPDGCGENCGACTGTQACVNGLCVTTVCIEWTCEESQYNAGDGCHCECGCWDPDCNDPEAPVYNCIADQKCVSPGTCGTGTQDENLFFSEYIEGSSNNKAVEIYNAGDEPVDLQNCKILRYSNGSESSILLFISEAQETLLDIGEVWVVCNYSFDAANIDLCDYLNGGLVFNGDDALALVCGETTLDVFGVIGVDPGEYWANSSEYVKTKDMTLRRKCFTTTGNIAGFSDPSAEWAAFAEDTFNGLGFHDCGECTVAGFILDCDGDCGPETLLGDGNCDDGTSGLDFACAELEWDEGDCLACVPDCAAKECGTDGCDGTCGECPDAETCMNGLCDTVACIEWTCEESQYNAGDGCHCDCGCWDPDCNEPGAITLNCDAGEECTVPGVCSGGPPNENLFFSEYVEGSGYNKAVEIFNAGGEPVDLKNCAILRYSNGSTTSIILFISEAQETLLDIGEVWVVCNYSFDAANIDLCDYLNGGLNHNGDDTLELTCGDTTLDVFGEIGVDPGSYWANSDESVKTQDMTLRRKCSVAEGNASGFSDPKDEWLAFPEDTFEGLGVHVCGECDAGGILDCDGICGPETALGDGICDDGTWGADFNCDELGWDGGDCLACVPDCEGMECGDDGCGGSCGECAGDEFCNLGLCKPDCISDCSGKECGNDGCDGSCGECDSTEECVEGQCLSGTVEPYPDIVSEDMFVPDTHVPEDDTLAPDAPAPGVDSSADLVLDDTFVADAGDAETGGGSKSGGCSVRDESRSQTTSLALLLVFLVLGISTRRRSWSAKTRPAASWLRTEQASLQREGGNRWMTGGGMSVRAVRYQGLRRCVQTGPLGTVLTAGLPASATTLPGGDSRGAGR